MTKVWFITGAGSGLGLGTAKAALRAGDRVVATGRNAEKVRQALAAEAGDNLAVVHLDVTVEDQARAAVAAAVQRYGRVDVAVNNAGYSILGNFEELTNAEIGSQFATNFWGVVNVMRAALPVMRAQRSGRLITISSVAGVVGLKHCAAYGAAKFAVEGLSLAVRTEVERFGIAVTVVEPGFFRTELLAPANVRWPSRSIDDYAGEGTAEQMWSPYHGTQQGDPDRFGDALVTLAGMDRPPAILAAGGDALAMITPAIEQRLGEMHANAALSRSTDGMG